jgi:hypothetical protein
VRRSAPYSSFVVTKVWSLRRSRAPLGCVELWCLATRRLWAAGAASSCLYPALWRNWIAARRVPAVERHGAPCCQESLCACLARRPGPAAHRTASGLELTNPAADGRNQTVPEALAGRKSLCSASSAPYPIPLSIRETRHGATSSGSAEDSGRRRLRAQCAAH